MTDQSYPLTSFTWSKEEKRLHTNASDLQLPPGKFPEIIRIKSHHTGQVVSFLKHGYRVTPDNDLERVYYHPLISDINVVRLVIYND